MRKSELALRARSRDSKGGMFMKRCLLGASAVVALLYPAGPQYAQSPPSRGNLAQTALDSVRVGPEAAVQYDYVMTARVRLLLFWAGKDDVGGGYIRRGRLKEEPRKEFFQVLFGSDPGKAPRSINRWGAGTEVSLHATAEPLPDN